MNKYKITVSVLSVCMLAGLGACSPFPSEEGVPPPIIQAGEFDYNTIEVSKSSISKTVTKNGNLVSATQHNLSFEKRGGYIVDFPAKSRTLVKKGDILASLDTESLEQQVAEQEIIVRIAQINYDEILTNAWRGTSDPAVQRAQAELDLAQMRLVRLNEEFESSVVRSPIDGMISYAALLKPGDFIDTRQTIITISDAADLVVMITSKNVSDLLELTSGLEVNLEHKRENYQGIVTVTPTDAPKDAFFNTDPFVMITFSEKPPEMEIGQNVKVSFDTEFREDVVVVPSNAVTQYGNYAYVQVLENGVRRERPVEIGLTTPTEIEIIKGLEPGELLIVR